MSSEVEILPAFDDLLDHLPFADEELIPIRHLEPKRARAVLALVAADVAMIGHAKRAYWINKTFGILLSPQDIQRLQQTTAYQRLIGEVANHKARLLRHLRISAQLKAAERLNERLDADEDISTKLLLDIVKLGEKQLGLTFRASTQAGELAAAFGVNQ